MEIVAAFFPPGGTSAEKCDRENSFFRTCSARRKERGKKAKSHNRVRRYIVFDRMLTSYDTFTTTSAAVAPLAERGIIDFTTNFVSRRVFAFDPHTDFNPEL